MSRVKLEKPKGITIEYQRAYIVLSDFLKKTYDDMDEPISDVLNEIENIFTKRSCEDEENEENEEGFDPYEDNKEEYDN